MKVIVQDLPSIKFIRSFRKIIQVIGETLADYCIGKVEQWNKLISDGTGRHHTALQNLVIGISNGERLRPLILLTYIILKGETYKKQFESVLSTITGCGKQMDRWLGVLEHLQPPYQNDIPDTSSTVHLETTHELDFKTPEFPTILYIAITVLTKIICICNKCFMCYFG